MELTRNSGYAFDKHIPENFGKQDALPTVISLFNQQCLKYPDNIAIEFEEKKLTYKQCDELAQKTACFLYKHSVSSGDVVAIKLQRSVEVVVAIMGILKAGGVFLCIDPTYPESRIEYMLKNSGAKCLITDESTPDHISTPSYLIKDILSDKSTFSDGDQFLFDPTPDDLAYIVYTSGTTGNPKGAMITHSGLVNMIQHHQHLFDITCEDRVLQFASISFDASVFEIFLALLTGARLVLISKDTIYDKEAFLDYLRRYKVSVSLLPPVFLASLGRPNLETMRVLITGGEACNFDDARHYSKALRFFNAYGPSEASVIVSIYEVDPAKNYDKYIPIGKAINNIKFYVLDEFMNPVPPGESGELFVSGIGLGKGYINNKELSEKFFIPHPHHENEMLYKTGDLVREGEDGNIIILGRTDSQVKILGHRIELSAVEAVMNSLESVTNALVLVKEDEKGQKILCGYYSGTKEIPAIEVRNDLLRQLPAFMVPQYFLQVKEFVLTTNGKIDKSKLPEPKALNSNKHYTFTDEKDRRLALLWQQVLGIDEIGPEDHFFLLGGHSLKASELVIRIHKEFNIKLYVSDVFKHPVFKQLSEMLETCEEHEYNKILPVQEQKYYPLSSAQRRMYIMSSSGNADVSYNVSVVLEFSQSLEKENVQQAFTGILNKHEILRTRYVQHEEEIMQEIVDAKGFSIECFSVKKENLAAEAKIFIRPFNLAKAPILRVGYFEIEEGGSAIVFDSHHIAVDGTSVGIMVMEFIGLLNGKESAVPEIHYKDYAVWEHFQYVKPEYFGEHEKFWLNMYKTLPDFKLPVDFKEQNENAFKGERLEYFFSHEQVRKIYELTQQQHISLFQFFLANYYLFLSKYVQTNDVVIGTAVANRNLEEVQSMLGMFVNTLGIRFEINQEWTYRELLSKVSEHVMQCFQYQEYPFERLIEKLGLVGSNFGIPLIDTTIVVQNLDFFKKDFSEDLTYKYENNSDTSKFGVSIFIIESKDNFFMQVDYNTQLFRKETIQEFTNAFARLIESSFDRMDEKVGKINLIDAFQLQSVKELLHKSNEEKSFDFDF